ncbi:MAG: VanR-ABDEGLN family response regulator transcription factor [Firmicutes bacterium]|nr:VanR-ABDEGLN family response regulator transcription factor [Bacillota bacterium]
MQETILVVDDEREITDLLEVYLSNDGFRVIKCYNGRAALAAIEQEKEKMDLAILDIMLPDISGFDLCCRIRDRYTYPIIMLTARGEDMDKINGLSLGADDYVTKPFNPLELMARVKAQLRRAKRYSNVHAEEEEKDVLDLGGLVINRATHECTLYGKQIGLTPIEFKILWVLCENRGEVVSSEQLFEQVWQEKYLDCNNTVMVHIRRLREKLGEPARKPKWIKTVWGVGYKVEKG